MPLYKANVVPSSADLEWIPEPFVGSRTVPLYPRYDGNPKPGPHYEYNATSRYPAWYYPIPELCCGYDGRTQDPDYHYAIPGSNTITQDPRSHYAIPQCPFCQDPSPCLTTPSAWDPHYSPYPIDGGPVTDSYSYDPGSDCSICNGKRGGYHHTGDQLQDGGRKSIWDRVRGVFSWKYRGEPYETRDRRSRSLRMSPEPSLGQPTPGYPPGTAFTFWPGGTQVHLTR